MKKALVCLGIAAALVASAAVLEPTKLARTVKENDSHRVEVTVELDFQGQMLTYMADGKYTVKSVASDGTVVMEEATENAVINIDGMEQPAGVDQVATVTYNKNGTIKNIQADMMDDTTYRFLNLMIVVFPDKEVEKGESWEVVQKENSDQSTPETTFKFTFEGLEDYKGTQVAKIKYSTTEKSDLSPAKSEGTMWINASNGFLMKAEGTMTNLPANGMVFPSATYKVESA